MSLLDDIAIFRCVIFYGGFSHAAKQLGLSNGLISRRINRLEENLGSTLIKRTTRQLNLTAEGEILLAHAQRIQQELDCALANLQEAKSKPKGLIRISAPVYFGSRYLSPILMNFLKEYEDIKIDLELTNSPQDLIQKELDLVIRGTGFLTNEPFSDSSLRMKLLASDQIGLYASPGYLLKHSPPLCPEDLIHHKVIQFFTEKSVSAPAWEYSKNIKKVPLNLTNRFSCNDIETNLKACISDEGIGRFTQLAVREALKNKELCPILQSYDWGTYHLYIMYQQMNLPKRTRLLLDFISENMPR